MIRIQIKCKFQIKIKYTQLLTSLGLKELNDMFIVRWAQSWWIHLKI